MEKTKKLKIIISLRSGTEISMENFEHITQYSGSSPKIIKPQELELSHAGTINFVSQNKKDILSIKSQDIEFIKISEYE